MKVAGKSLVHRSSAEITVKRGEETFTLRITSLPIGWHDTVANHRMPQPVPPKIFSKDSQGRHIKLANKQLQTELDYNDPDFKKKSDLWDSRYAALAICDLLREDESVSWETPPVDPATAKVADWEAFADGIIGELNKAGFTDQEMQLILGAGNAISTGVNTDEALARFLSNQDSTMEVVEAS